MLARSIAFILAFSMTTVAFAGSVHVENRARWSVVFGESPREALRAPDKFYFSLGYQHELAKLKKSGFTPLTTAWGTRYYSDSRFLVKNDLLAPVFAKKFLGALEKQKLNLMKIFYLSDDEYNRLALMAFGVAAQESKLGRSLKYLMKENGQFAVTWVKEIDAWWDGDDYDGRNSRGPTQIKTIPAAVKKYYGINESDLSNPTLAAVATLGFLAQTYNEMLVRARDRERFHFINEETIYDYTLYAYFGGLRRVLRRAALPKDLDLNTLSDDQLDPFAIPEMNAYLKTVKRTIRWVTVLERSPRLKYDFR